MVIKKNEENLPIYGVKKTNLSQFEKKSADLKKGVSSKEPGDENRLEEEDLLKMNLDDAIFIGHGDDIDDDDSDQDIGYEIKEECSDEIDVVDIGEMSPTIRQYREAAFGTQNSGANSGHSGAMSVKSECSSPNSWEILKDINIEARNKTKKSQRNKKTSFDS